MIQCFPHVLIGHLSFGGELSLHILSPFFMRVVFYCSESYILDKVPSQIWLINIFLPLCQLSFDFLVQRTLGSTSVLNFKSSSFFFCLCIWCSQKPLPDLNSWFTPVLSSKNFVALTLRCVIGFELVLHNSVW